jgi:hypothetical protein
MIWFTCKQCGKTHGRPENSVGSLVFCECGAGNTVPWESTVAEPEQPTVAPVTLADAPAVPELAPLSFEPTIAPTKADSSSYNMEPALRRRGRGGERRDPDYCFNHQERPRAAACDDCGEPFCSDCIVKFQGVTLCGPCKNFRVRSMELPPATSSLATASVAISLLTGVPLVFCLLPFGQSVLSLLALLPQLVALGLGGRALYLAEKEGKYGSQAWAVTGVAAAALTVILTILLNVYASRLA